MARVMGDMLLLPNGRVLIVNGASPGVAGWELGRNPVLSPLTYRPNNQLVSCLEVQNPSTIPRVYHSAVVLLRDGLVHVHYYIKHFLVRYFNTVIEETVPKCKK